MSCRAVSGVSVRLAFKGGLPGPSLDSRAAPVSSTTNTVTSKDHAAWRPVLPVKLAGAEDDPVCGDELEVRYTDDARCR
jgi:hypothetical protein